jgi:hypothetical protein
LRDSLKSYNSARCKSVVREALDLSRAGKKCSGPRPIKNGVLKVPCPFNSIIRDTTTRLARYHDNKLCTYGYYYPSRCEKCSALALQRKRLHRLRLLADDDAPVTCSHGACLLSRWQDAILCRPHLLKAFSDEKQNLTRQGNVIEVQKYIRSHRFRVTSKFRSVLDVLDGVGLQERRAWCIDLEFSTRKKIVYEVSIVDYHTGAVVLDAIVNQNEEAILQARKRPRALDGEDSVEDYDQCLIELRHRRAIYNGGHQAKTELLDAHSIARIIRGSKIKPTDIMFEHASCQLDLRMLREFLEPFGYDDLLPPLSNCIQTIPDLRKLVPVGTSAALDIVFPLLFPNDPLVGQNHRARPDALMCRKIVGLIREVIKPPEEQKLTEYEPEIIRLLFQTSSSRNRKEGQGPRLVSALSSSD